jgi:hypothetical protein
VSAGICGLGGLFCVDYNGMLCLTLERTVLTEQVFSICLTGLIGGRELELRENVWNYADIYRIRARFSTQ